MSFIVQGSTIVINSEALTGTPSKAWSPPNRGTTIQVLHVRVDASAPGTFKVGFGSDATPPVGGITDEHTVWTGHSASVGQVMDHPAAPIESKEGHALYVEGAGIANGGSIEIRILPPGAKKPGS